MQYSSSMSHPSAAVRGLLVLALVVCLVECATGSCLSYGHSCWGAHGKRSGKAAASPPDWYVARVLRRLAADDDMKRAKQTEYQKDDDLYRAGAANEAPATDRFTEEVPFDFGMKNPDARPMLDDDTLSRLKLWQMMRAAAESE